MDKENENGINEAITPQTDFYTLEHIDKVWDIKVRYLREQIKNGKLVAKVVGKKYFVLHSDLFDFIKTRNDAKL